MNINILLKVDDTFKNKAKYVFETLCGFMSIQPVFIDDSIEKDIHLYYGEKQDNNALVSIYHNPEVAVFYTQKVIYNPDDVNYLQYDDIKLPFLFSNNKDIMTEDGNKHIFISQDIIASAFYFLSCWQEYALNEETYPGYRFDYKKSIQYHGKFVEIPIVDY